MARRLDTAALGAETEERIPPLVLQIADTLVADIIGGRLQPGERIREQEIADRLGVSRGPVREALRLCEHDGLVEVQPWRGARVVDLSPAEVDDLFEVLSAVIGLVARLAAVHADETALDRFEALVARMELLAEKSGDLGEQLRLSFEAGVVLRKHCGSARAGQMLMRVGRLAYWQHRFLLDADRAWRRRSVAKYRRLVEALRARNPARAEALTRAVVAQSKAYVLGRMQTRASEAAVPPPLRDLPGPMQLKSQAEEGGVG